jgi:hypothetical protein
MKSLVVGGQNLIRCQNTEVRSDAPKLSKAIKKEINDGREVHYSYSNSIWKKYRRPEY